MKITITIESDSSEHLELKELIQNMNDELRQYAQKIDAATSQIAQRIQSLIDNQQLSAEAKQELDRIVANLEQLGKDPNQDPGAVVG